MTVIRMPMEWWSSRLFFFLSTIKGLQKLAGALAPGIDIWYIHSGRMRFSMAVIGKRGMIPLMMTTEYHSIFLYPMAM